MEEWVVLSDSDRDSVKIVDDSDVGSDSGGEGSFAVVRVTGRSVVQEPVIAAAEEGDVAGSDDTADIAGVCSHAKGLDTPEMIVGAPDESDCEEEDLDDDDTELFDLEDIICENSLDGEFFHDGETDSGQEDEESYDEDSSEFDSGNFGDEEEGVYEDNLDDDETLEDDASECFDLEDIICHENTDEEFFDDKYIEPSEDDEDTGSSDDSSEEESVVEEDDYDDESIDSESFGGEGSDFGGVTYDDIDAESSDESTDSEENHRPEFTGGEYDGVDEQRQSGFAGVMYDDTDDERFDGEERLFHEYVHFYGELLALGAHGDSYIASSDDEEDCTCAFCVTDVSDDEEECNCAFCMTDACFEDYEGFPEFAGDEHDDLMYAAMPAWTTDNSDDELEEAGEVHGNSTAGADREAEEENRTTTLAASMPSRAAGSMARAAGAIDSYLRTAGAAGLAAGDAEALWQGAASLRAMAAAPSFADQAGVRASSAAAAAAAAAVRREIATGLALLAFRVFFLVILLLWRIGLGIFHRLSKR